MDFQYKKIVFDTNFLVLNLTFIKVTPYGHTYDRKNIEAYIEKFGIDPMTRKKLAKEELAPNYTVRELIEHFDQERITKEQKTKEEHDPSKQ